MSAIEGERAGLVAEVWPKGEVLNKAIEAAQEIARLPSVAVSMAMDCVKQGSSPVPFCNPLYRAHVPPPT